MSSRVRGDLRPQPSSGVGTDAGTTSAVVTSCNSGRRRRSDAAGNRPGGSRRHALATTSGASDASADGMSHPSESSPGYQVDLFLPGSSSSLPVFTAEQVAEHCTAQDCWIIVHGRVYDVTAFIENHRGGTESILKNAGTDCTYHVQFHSPLMMKLLKRYYLVGRLEPTSDQSNRPALGCAVS